jgi:hypothetical protein
VHFTVVEAKKKQKAEADAEVKARKRMLGNIIFVGQLFRMGVLTESVMHTCIRQLLDEVSYNIKAYRCLNCYNIAHSYLQFLLSLKCRLRILAMRTSNASASC